MPGMIAHWFALARTAYERRRAVDTLLRLSEAQLRDVGLERDTLEESVREGLPWQAYEPAPVQRPQPILQGCG